LHNFKGYNDSVQISLYIIAGNLGSSIVTEHSLLPPLNID